VLVEGNTRDEVYPAVVSFPSTGGMGVSIHTLGSCVAGALARAAKTLAAAAMGIPEGGDSRKLKQL